MRALRLDRSAPFPVDQRGNRVGEFAGRVILCFDALGFEEQRPAGAEALEYVVGAGAGADQFGLGGAFKIGTAKAQRALENCRPC